MTLSSWTRLIIVSLHKNYNHFINLSYVHKLSYFKHFSVKIWVGKLINPKQRNEQKQSRKNTQMLQNIRKAISTVCKEVKSIYPPPISLNDQSVICLITSLSTHKHTECMLFQRAMLINKHIFRWQPEWLTHC